MNVSLRLDHLSLRVKDLNASIKFYQSVFGMEVISHVADDYAHLSFGGPRKTLSLIEGESTSQAAVLAAGSGSAHFAMEASDMLAFYAVFERLKSSGSRYKLVDHDVTWAIYLEDPDRHRVEIFVWRQKDDVVAWQGATRFLAEETIQEEYERLKSES
jgi:catechol 2,3-dioxygenase-like lactoylglutathione lyase family enzyme